MKALFAIAVPMALVGFCSHAIAQIVLPPQAPPPIPNADAYYKLGPDSLPQDGVPKGELKGPFSIPSEAYPGTQHTYWVYVPAQYNPAKLHDGVNHVDGEEIFFISHPALGLWASSDRFKPV